MKLDHRPAVLLLAMLFAACRSESAPERASGDAAVAEAEALITALTFDTISWASDSAALARGAIVWQWSCQKCHGDWGDGDGGFVMRGDTVRPPSFRTPDWRFADDREGLRRQVFVGTANGMPHWGMEGLKPRDMDAVARYIQQVLRR